MSPICGPCSSSMLQSQIKPCVASMELMARIDPGMFSGCQGHLHQRHWLHKSAFSPGRFLLLLLDQVKFGARGGRKRPGGTPWHAANAFARASVPCGLFWHVKTLTSTAKAQA